MSGHLQMVSVGPGREDHITPAARSAIERAEVIVGYDLYLTWIREWIAGKQVITHPLTEEKQRAIAAIEHARNGKNVVIVSSGDIGVYGMATLVFEEMAESDDFEVAVIPGVTAANACASLLGAPLAHDYLVLSLSDLLCPWDWIEKRAQQAAQADLCMAFYNVCSKKRPDGIYKILDLVSRFKAEETLCGVVRNAYRDGQSAHIATLGELKSSQFDMLTSIIIGNRFTRRRRNWLFTPRGYNQWHTAQMNAAESAAAEVPTGAIWVFSGTSDGNVLARELADSGRRIVISTATEYGARLAAEACPTAYVVSGKLGEARRGEMLRRSQAKAVVDATHPYADAISQQLISIAESLELPYIRFERPPVAVASQRVHFRTDLEQAFHAATQIGKRIFLACGCKSLDELPAHCLVENDVFIRVTPEAESVRKAIDCGIRQSNIIAMQGPFSKELNIAMWRDLQIDSVVTKESGAAGGFDAKVEAAAQLGIPLFVVRRPDVAYPAVASCYSDVTAFLTGVN